MAIEKGSEVLAVRSVYLSHTTICQCDSRKSADYLSCLFMGLVGRHVDGD